MVDECIGLSVAQWLRNKGFNVISVFSEMRGSDDETILAKAFSENRIVITKDKDFGEMVFRYKKPHCGIILLRLLNEQASNKMRVLQNLLHNYQDQLIDNYIVATETSVRIIKPDFN